MVRKGWTVTTWCLATALVFGCGEDEEPLVCMEGDVLSSRGGAFVCASPPQGPPDCADGQTLTVRDGALECSDAIDSEYLPSCQPDETLVIGALGFSCASPIDRGSCQEGEALFAREGAYVCEQVFPVCGDEDVLVFADGALGCEVPYWTLECAPDEVVWFNEGRPKCARVIAEYDGLDVARRTLTELASSRYASHRSGVLSNPNVTPALLDVLADDPWLHERLLGRDDLPEATLLRIIDEEVAQIGSIASSPSVTEAALISAAQRHEDTRGWELGQLAASHAAGPGFIAWLLQDAPASASPHLIAYAHPDFDPDEAATLVTTSSDPATLIALASNPSLPEASLTELSTSQDSRVRENLTRNPSTPGAALENILANTPTHCRTCQRELAVHPRATPALLESFTDSGAILSAHKNPNLAAERMRAVAAGDAAGLRAALCTNPSLVADVLDLLLTDPEDNVRDQCARRAALSPAQAAALASEPDLARHLALLENPSTPPEVLDTIAGTSRIGSSPAALILSHPRVDDRARVTLAAHTSGRVRALVAEDPATPAATLEVLLGDADVRVLAELARNPSSTPQITSSLLAAADPAIDLGLATRGDLTDEAYRALSARGMDRVLASNPATPPDVLDAIAQEWADELGGLIALNTSADLEVIEGLLYHPGSGTRERAAANARIEP